MKKKLINSIISLVILGFFCTGVLFSWAHHQRDRAQVFLQEIVSLQVGVSTFSDAQRLAQKYGGKPWNGPSQKPICSDKDCNLRFVFENSLLNHLQHKRKVSLTAGLLVKDGYVVSREVDYSILATTFERKFMFVVFDRTESKSPQSYNVKKLKVDTHGMPHAIEVDLSPTSPAEIKRRAYSLDLSCIASLMGCDTASAVFPAGW